MAESEMLVLHQMMIPYSVSESGSVCQLQEFPPPPLKLTVKGETTPSAFSLQQFSFL